MEDEEASAMKKVAEDSVKTEALGTGSGMCRESRWLAVGWT